MRRLALAAPLVAAPLVAACLAAVTLPAAAQQAAPQTPVTEDSSLTGSASHAVSVIAETTRGAAIAAEKRIDVAYRDAPNA